MSSRRGAPLAGAALLAALLGAACASATVGGVEPARWSGDLKTTHTGGGTAVIQPGVSAEASSYGSVTLAPSGEAERHTRVEMSVTSPPMRSSQLGWAVFTGPCSAASPPLIGAAEFPLVEMQASGTGVVRADLPFAMDARQSYHVSVYKSARVTDQSDVLMCAPLRYRGPRP